jgi:hypothetical protein
VGKWDWPVVVPQFGGSCRSQHRTSLHRRSLSHNMSMFA